MYKYFLASFTLIIIFGACWIMYLKYENTRFAESLPHPPEKEQTVKQTVRKTEKKSSINQEVPTLETSSVASENESIEPEETSTPEVKNNSTESKPHSHQTETPKAQSDVVGKDEERKAPLPLDISKMSSDEISKSVRDSFVKKTEGAHRDEIDIVARLMPKIIRREGMSLTERYDFQKALTTLNPTPRNKEGLRVIEDRMRKHTESPRASEHINKSNQ